MYRKFVKISLLFGVMAPNLLQATTYVPGGFDGKWNCNLDGRSARLEFFHEDIQQCSGSVCSIIPGGRLVGRISDNGGAWQRLDTRSLDSSDPTTSNRAHILPMTLQDGEKWLLMVNTWKDSRGYSNYLSGFSRWRGTIYPIQCQRI